MERLDVFSTDVALSADFVNEPSDEPRDSQADFIDMISAVISTSTFSIYTVTLSNTIHTCTDRHKQNNKTYNTDTYTVHDQLMPLPAGRPQK